MGRRCQVAQFGTFAHPESALGGMTALGSDFDPGIALDVDPGPSTFVSRYAF